MQVLDHEQFEGAKELAEIGKSIAEGRALVSTLKASEEEYLDGREKEAIDRIQKVLVESKDLIAAIGVNHASLVGYRREVSEYVADLRCFIEAVKQWGEAVKRSVAVASQALQKQSEELRALILEERKEATHLESERGLIHREREGLVKDTRVAQDALRTLERAEKELKAKK